MLYVPATMRSCSPIRILAPGQQCVSKAGRPAFLTHWTPDQMQLFAFELALSKSKTDFITWYYQLNSIKAVSYLMLFNGSYEIVLYQDIRQEDSNSHPAVVRDTGIWALGLITVCHYTHTLPVSMDIGPPLIFRTLIKVSATEILSSLWLRNPILCSHRASTAPKWEGFHYV